MRMAAGKIGLGPLTQRNHIKDVCDVKKNSQRDMRGES